jgi:hypothetical protein
LYKQTAIIAVNLQNCLLRRLVCVQRSFLSRAELMRNFQTNFIDLFSNV